MSIFFWSDTHFNHVGIIKFCARPYNDVAQMNLSLIDRWNASITSKDTIWFVGDFGFSAKYEGTTPLNEIFAQLQGHKNLVIGNHDERNPKVLDLPWEKQVDLATIRDTDMRAVACHYPMTTWKNSHHGYIMVHGHSHGTLKQQMPHRFDVGADVEMFPVAFKTLWERATVQKYEPADYHGDRNDPKNNTAEI